MNSLLIQKRITAAIAAATVLALASGCSTNRSQARYNSNPAPIVNNGQAAEAYETPMGGTGASYETQSGGASSMTSDNKDMVIPLQREKLIVGEQQVNNGSVRIRKMVKTETVTQPAQVREETVTVDRVPPNAAQANAAGTALNTPFQGGEITINLTKEQPVVQTEAVPAGSVVIHKQETTQPVNVQGQVRTEDVVATPIGNPQNVTISSNLQNPDNQQSANWANPNNEAAGAAPPTAGQSSGAGSSQQITQLNQLSSAPDPSAVAGRQVNIANAKVQKVISSQLITVIAPDGTTFCVRSDQPLNGISAGQTVNLNGTVRQTPSDTANLGWDQPSAQALQGQQIFIEVPMIAPAGQ